MLSLYRNKIRNLFFLTPVNNLMCFKLVSRVIKVKPCEGMISIFTRSDMPSPESEYLDTSEPKDLAIAITLGVVLPLVVLGYLCCFGTLVLCVLKRRKKKKEKKKLTKKYYATIVCSKKLMQTITFKQEQTTW